MRILGSARFTSLYVTFSQRITDYQQQWVQISVIDDVTLSINHADIQRFMGDVLFINEKSSQISINKQIKGFNCCIKEVVVKLKYC